MPSPVMPRSRTLAAGAVPAALAFSVLASCSSPAAPGGGGGGGGGGPTVTQIASADQPGRILAKSGYLYWSQASSDPLQRMSLASGAVSTLNHAWPIPESALSDGTYVYWVSGSALYRTTIDGLTTAQVDSGVRDLVVTTPAIAMDAGNLYWVNSVPSGGCSPACQFIIRKVPKAGGAATTVASMGQRPVALAVANGSVIWVEFGLGPVTSGSTLGSAVRKASLTTGTVQTLADALLNGLVPPPPPGYIQASWLPDAALAVDDSAVYFGDYDSDKSYRVLRVPFDSGAVTVMAHVINGDPSNTMRDLTQDASALYWVDKTGVRTVSKGGGTYSDMATGRVGPLSITRVGSNLFWIESPCCAHGDIGTVLEIPVTGGAPSVIKSGINVAVSITADANYLYWVSGGGIGQIEHLGGLDRSNFDGSAQIPIVDIGCGGLFDVDATNVYCGAGFAIKKIPLTGGKSEVIAVGGFYVSDLATDGAYVYWVQKDPLATVARVAVDGGPVQVLASGAGPGGPLHLDADYVYWMNANSDVRRVAKGGGAVQTVLGPIAGMLTDFTIAGGSLLFAEWDGVIFASAPVAGGSITTLANPGTVDQMRRVASDGASLFWIDQTEVGSVATAGGPQDIIAFISGTSPYDASSITVDGTSVYWTEIAAGKIMKATPK